jgi:hypothetical protein
MTSSLPVQGIGSMVATVVSVSGNVAHVRDQTGRTLFVRRDFQRAKGPWPEVGEQWIIDKNYGNDWSFAMLITPSNTPLARPAVMPVADLAGRNAIVAPVAGQMALRMDSKYVDTFDGTIWRGSKTVPMAQPNATLGWTAVQNTALNTSYTVASISIPDPGWPYYIEGTAGMTIAVADGNSGFSHSSAVLVDSTSIPTGPANNIVTYAFVGASSQGFENAMPPWGRSQGTWSGAHTVNFVFHNGAAGTASFGPLNVKGEWHFNLDILPA